MSSAMNTFETSTSICRYVRSARTGRTLCRVGGTMVMLAILMPIVLAIASYAINVAYMELARTELQITTDIATRAAGRELTVTGDETKARAAAERLLQANPFAGHTLSLQEADIVFGVSTRYSEEERYQFKLGKNPNAVKLDASGKVKVPALFPTLGVPVNFRPFKSAISTQVELDIALVLDRSGSMTYASDACSTGGSWPPGWYPGAPVPADSRWLDAASSVRQFTNLLTQTNHHEHLALASYSTLATCDHALDENYGACNTIIKEYSDCFLGGSTNIGDGILNGLSLLSDKKAARPWATRVMILLTDGIHTVGTDPIYAAQVAAGQNVSIYTISFSDEADIAVMDRIAAIGQGQHFHATDGSELTTAFHLILNNLPSLITY
ncbi:MAG: VWA domain-containing protein [Pirellulales bacterium]